MKKELEKEDHFMSLMFAIHRETIKSMEKIIITDEVRQGRSATLVVISLLSKTDITDCRWVTGRYEKIALISRGTLKA